LSDQQAQPAAEALPADLPVPGSADFRFAASQVLQQS